MRSIALVVLALVSAFTARTAIGAGQPQWMLPHDREVYLMEDDLVYARFLTLERGGTYRQINRDERGSTEVDNGTWEQNAAGTVRLHSSCRALRPRALSSGPLSITLPDGCAFDGLPSLLASLRQFLAVYPDAVFGAETMSEISKTGAPTIHLSREAVTFDRRDAATLATRIEAAVASEPSATYLLEPVKNDTHALFVLQGSVFEGTDLTMARETYRIADGKIPPFYFARVEAKIYAAAIGCWQPLHLPGDMQ